MAPYSDHIICISIQQFYANGTNTSELGVNCKPFIIIINKTACSIMQYYMVASKIPAQK